MAPPDMPLKPGGGNYERFRDFLSSRSELTFIDAEPIMKGLKTGSAELLYAKGDIHATQFAQRAVVKEIVARIAQIEGRPDIHWDEKLTLTHLHWRGGIERNVLAVLFIRRITRYRYYEGGYSDRRAGTGRAVDRDRSQLRRSGRSGHWTAIRLGIPFPAGPLPATRLPGMVLFGNSFSDDYWTLGLQRYFCFIRRARDPISRFELFMRRCRPTPNILSFNITNPGWFSITPPASS